MPSKHLAAKASVFDGNFVDHFASTVTTEPGFTKDGFFNDFFKMPGFFCGDIVGLEGASGLCSDQPGSLLRQDSAGGELAKEMSPSRLR